MAAPMLRSFCSAVEVAQDTVRNRLLEKIEADLAHFHHSHSHARRKHNPTGGETRTTRIMLPREELGAGLVIQIETRPMRPKPL